MTTKVANSLTPTRRRTHLRIILAAAVFVIVWFTLRHHRAGILLVRNNTVVELPSGRVMAHGSAAAWAPDYRTLVYARPGGATELVLRHWTLGLAFDRVLPLPAVDFGYLPTVYGGMGLGWQWSFSLDGRWLAIERRLNTRAFMHEHYDRDVAELAKDSAWMGVVDLKSWVPTKWKITGSSIGWREGKCLVQHEQYGSLIAIDPTNPTATEILEKNSGVITSLSPDGRLAIIYDGGEGNVSVTLRNLGQSARALYTDSFQRTKNYGAGGSVAASFSSDGACLGTTTLHWSDNIWTATVAIDSLDGTNRLYEDRFELDTSYAARPPIWSPVGPLHLAYFRFPRHAAEGELVIVALRQGRLSRVVVPHVLRGDFRHPSVASLWSPSGNSFVWFSVDRTVNSTDPETGENRILMDLPERFPQWRWATP